jgi:hypothetical protein
MSSEWLALTDDVLRSCIAEMGVDVGYTRAPADPVLVRGVYDGAYQLEELVDGLPLASIRPVLGVRLGDLPGGVALRGDTLGPLEGVNYRVANVQPDGQGGALLILEKT